MERNISEPVSERDHRRASPIGAGVIPPPQCSVCLGCPGTPWEKWVAGGAAEADMALVNHMEKTFSDYSVMTGGSVPASLVVCRDCLLVPSGRRSTSRRPASCC